MVLWVFRRVRSLVCAVIALAGMVSMAEVGLRIARVYAVAEGALESVNERPRWMVPSGSTGWELPRAAKISLATITETQTWGTNSWGTRGPEITVPKPPGVYRILCLGDETLLGSESADDVLFAHHLQELLQQRTQYRIEVVNAPLPCGCPLTLAIHYRLRLTALQPDLVLLQTSAGDVEDDRILRRWTVRDARSVPLACVHPDFRQAPREHLVAACRSEFALVDWCFQQLAAAGNHQPDAMPAVGDPIGTLQQERVRECLLPVTLLASHCEATHSRLVVWLAPQVGTSQGFVRHREYAAQAGSHLAEQHLPVVDVGNGFDAELFNDSTGWSAAGHRFAAEIVAGQLIQNLSGPWSSPYATPSAVPASYSTQAPGEIPEIRRATR